jgi:hypothetical protein
VLLPDPVPAHPLLAGKREIGRGEYSIVLDKGDGERVYKICTSPADYVYYTAPDRPLGEHFPQVFADHGVIGTSGAGYPMHLIEMERLYPLAPDAAANALAKQLIAAYWEGCGMWSGLAENMGRIALYNMTVGPFAGEQGIKRALEALGDFVEEYQVLPDIIKSDNLMMRADGTLVFSDPVFMG